MNRRIVPLGRACLVGLLSLALNLPFAPTAMARGSDPSGSLRALAEQRRVIETLRAELDPADFDLAALGLELAFEEAQQIVERLQVSLAYEVYAGVLRGAQGTLVAGAGNAFDQALLLGRLLADAGYQTRLALGRLDEADGRRLLARMFVPPPGAAAAAADIEAAAALLARASGATAAEAAADLKALSESRVEQTEDFLVAEATQDWLLQRLRQAGQPLGADLSDTLLAEARDYAWTEYRLSGNEPWQAAHLAFGQEAPPAVEAASYLDGALPSELLHRLRIEVSIERKVGDDFQTVQLMQPWERPVANLFGQTIQVGNQPWGAGADASLLELGSDLADLSFYVPTLNGQLAPGAQAFDTLGNLLPPDVAADPAAALFQTVGGRTAEATSILGGLGSDEPAEELLALVAQWVDLVLITPDGQETRHRRVVFDRLSPEARANGGSELLDPSVLLRGILSDQAIMVVPGALSDAYLAEQGSSQALLALGALETLATALADDPQAQADDLLRQATSALEPRDHLPLVAAFDAVGAAQGGVAYRAEPTLLVLHQALTPGEGASARMGVDIVHNARRFLSLRDGAVRSDVEQAVLAGSWETRVERAYMRRFSETVQDTYAAFEAAGGQATVVAAGDLQALAAADVPMAALPALRRDLEAGYALLLPAGATGMADGEGFAWWRVDPRSGETLGVVASGRGNAAVDYSVPLWVSGMLAGFLAVPGAMACAAGAGGAAMALCFCDLVTTTGIALGLGVLLAAMVGTGAGALVLFMAADIGGGVVTAIPGLIPGLCSAMAGAQERRPMGDRCWAA